MNKLIEAERLKNLYEYLTDWDISYYTTQAIKLSINPAIKFYNLSHSFSKLFSLSYSNSSPFVFFMQF